MEKWWIRSLISIVILNALICGNAIGQKNPDVIIEREVYEKVLDELAMLDSLRQENDKLKSDVALLAAQLETLTDEIEAKEKIVASINQQIGQNIKTTDDLVNELKSQVKLLNISKKEQKELLRQYQRRRWSQEEKRVAVVFLFAIIGMSVTIAISNLTR